jgi:hypothetical protein
MEDGIANSASERLFVERAERVDDDGSGWATVDQELVGRHGPFRLIHDEL